MAAGIIDWSPDGTDNWQAGCTEARYADGRMREECVRCYARVMSGRQRRIGTPRYQDATTGDGPNGARWTGRLTWELSAMRAAFRRLGPRKRRFLGSMTDLWHDDCDPEMHRALAAELEGLRGIAMFLTKRPHNLLAFQRRYFPHGLPRRMWVGVTAGSQRALDEMLPDLIRTHAWGVKFLSVEPMTGPVTVGLRGTAPKDWTGGAYRAMYQEIGWVIAGAESIGGRPGAPIELDWVRALRDECVDAGVPFFLKQMAVGGRIVGSPELDGRTWTEVPDV